MIAILFATSITSGFCMMALELLGGRILAPAFGSGIDVWAAIISVFILSLSVGYWLGGRIADRIRSSRALGWIIACAAIFYLLLPVYARHFIDALGPTIHTARGGVLLASIVLFLPPSLLLGCVTPVLVKLAFVEAGRVGRTTGTLYAVGSFGNVMGVLATDYLFLATFDLNHTILGMGVVLGLVGLTHIVIAMPASLEQVAASPDLPLGAEQRA